MSTIPLRRALVSVYEKSGLPALAAALHDAGIEIVSTGSTAARIAGAGVPVTPVEDVTGFPECLDGRVKTLHPRVHAGILADRDKPTHRAQLAELDVAPFDLVVVNLYPFSATVASGVGEQECVEQIDIGGPAMVRAAAKNHAHVAVVVDPARYDDVARAAAEGGFTRAQRRELATEAFRHTATYDVHVASWLGETVADATVATMGDAGEAGEAADEAPGWLGATWQRTAVLRYGENPHQSAALYADGSGGLAGAIQLHGKEMSYNNYADADAAWRAAHDHGEQACVAVIKHANPCGIAVGPDAATAHARAHACDPVSAFGGVIAANIAVDAAMASQVAEVFTEVVLAPGFTDEALAILTAKKNIRLLTVAGTTPGRSLRPIDGGLLVQSPDRLDAPGDDPAGWRLVTGEPADEATLADLAFAWRAVRAPRSNAILLAADGAAVGIGMGQVNRVDSCRLAVERANALGEGVAGADGDASGDGAAPPRRAHGSVAASDAFFPFADGLQMLLDAGVRAVVQPGGSVRDEEVVAAAGAAGVTMYLTGTRHFSH